MGSKIVAMVRQFLDLSLTGEIDISGSLADNIENSDVIIDFTTPAAAAENATIAASHSKPIVIGTTGLDEKQLAAINDAAHLIPIVLAPNMSIGINIMLALIEATSKAIKNSFQVDIEETHHIHKTDRPSGTAKAMLEAILSSDRHDKQKDVGIFEEAIPNETVFKKPPITVTSYRKNEIVGDHMIKFSSTSEILTISHSALTRDIFAEGALVAARWVVGKSPGLYNMRNVLGITHGHL